MKLFSKFDQKFLDFNKSHRMKQPSFVKRMAQFNMPRQLKNRTTQNVQCALDLTGDDDAVEGFHFIYKDFPLSMANAVVKNKNHMCTALCINVKLTDLDLTQISSTPPLLRPSIFGFTRHPITNTRLIRAAEADCDKIDCFYRTPCCKDIYDRLALDKYLTATQIGRHLEHDCFSFDKLVILNRQVDKSKLIGLVDDDISSGAEPKKIPMYNQVDDQKPPPLQYKVILITGINVLILKKR